MGKTRWDEIARAGEATKHKATVQELSAQLDAERKAHAETIRALESARAPRRKLAPITPSKSSTASGDIVEVIFSDVHGNQHDPKAFAALIGDLEVLNPNRIFIGGDFINCGGFLAEHHTLGYVAESDDSYESDIEVSNHLLDAIQRAAPNAEIHYLEGNHEWRVERWALTQRLAHHKDIEHLRKTFCAENVLRLAKRGIRYYRQGATHPGCTVPGWVKMDKLFYVHKISNAVDAASVAIAKAAGNIVFFDTHRGAFKPTMIPGVGLISAWNPGCLCQRQPLYANTNPTGWTHGYLVRFISKKTGAFQMVNVTINDGLSYGGLMLGRITED